MWHAPRTQPTGAASRCRAPDCVPGALRPSCSPRVAPVLAVPAPCVPMATYGTSKGPKLAPNLKIATIRPLLRIVLDSLHLIGLLGRRGGGGGAPGGPVGGPVASSLCGGRGVQCDVTRDPSGGHGVRPGLGAMDAPSRWTGTQLGVGVLGRHRRCCIELAAGGVLRLLAENAQQKDGHKTSWIRLSNRRTTVLYDCWVRWTCVRVRAASDALVCAVTRCSLPLLFVMVCPQQTARCVTQACPQHARGPTHKASAPPSHTPSCPQPCRLTISRVCVDAGMRRVCATGRGLVQGGGGEAAQVQTRPQFSPPVSAAELAAAAGGSGGAPERRGQGRKWRQGRLPAAMARRREACGAVAHPRHSGRWPRERARGVQADQ